MATKQELVEQINKLQTVLGIEPMDGPALMRNTKNTLIGIIQELEVAMQIQEEEACSNASLLKRFLNWLKSLLRK